MFSRDLFRVVKKIEYRSNLSSNIIQQQVYQRERNYTLIIYERFIRRLTESVYFWFQGKSRVREVYSQLTIYMVAQGMQDIELFALAFILGEWSVALCRYKYNTMYYIVPTYLCTDNGRCHIIIYNIIMFTLLYMYINTSFVYIV